MQNRETIPIDEVLPLLIEKLKVFGRAVLTAEPGAGKTTRTPLALLNEAWLDGQQIIMLEPRRLAARAAAVYMAQQLGEQVGETVGYRIRTESRVSARTRITVVTEGILTRMLQNDPGLDGVGLIIFDEFHERSLHADLGLALAMQSRSLLREDLRILVMSATLDAAAVAGLLEDAPVIDCQGSMYPVETKYMPQGANEPLEAAVSRVVQHALSAHSGSLLVFLPGAGEIRRVLSALEPRVGSDCILTPLYGALPQELQQQAIAAPPPGKRKIVLATSIAESSLTVSGITVVIDSGLRRTALFSPRTGMSRLATMRAARDSADQRRGRAGRLAPGVCYRLWSEAEHRLLAPATPPEMLEADLTPLALELAAWGASPEELRWLDVPPAAPYRQAAGLLRQLGAFDAAGVITPHGRQMAQLGLHPRLAHMLLRAVPLGLSRAACRLAALLEERDLFRGQAAAQDSDLRSRLSLVMTSGEAGSGPSRHADVDRSALQRLLQVSSQWERQLHKLCLAEQAAQEDWQSYCGLLVSLAYPDRIAQRRSDGRYLLRSGRGAAFRTRQLLGEEPFLAIAEVDDEGAEGRILLAAPLSEEHLHQFYREQMEEGARADWNEQTGTVQVRRRLTLGAILLQDRPDPHPTPERITEALLAAVAEQIDVLLPWNAKSKQLQARVEFLRRLDPSWPDLRSEALTANVHDWLAPYVSGMRKRSELQNLSMYIILENMLGWERMQELQAEVPTHLQVPSGSRIPIQYEGPQAPYVSVRLQEVFGMMETPRIGYGRIPITLHLLSPANRPVQVTSDLRSFWSGTYFEIKKDLKGRYPKHYWPDDPLQASATRKVRPSKP
ncbi:ATP-dependent helicase HrpB [Paenibacillus aceti]|uniref:ATP-dependent helicase HrpB n=1 Tax=Paenibacillus aceti TaxID=1820010 RepID=A0ABQ1W5R0_9BACL|nr:ATP-dependent helicase HrpB [Paenibacillus aceti]GGG15056.1 ATP-dependent helicase HrpB [Paenibacillus aceti]